LRGDVGELIEEMRDQLWVAKEIRHWLLESLQSLGRFEDFSPRVRRKTRHDISS